MNKKIIIGSRGSELALWQAHFVKDQLQDLGHEVEIKIISTKGDQIQHLSFDKIEGKGFFTSELEDQLLNNEVDLAVHSHKDLETNNPAGLVIGAVSYREDPMDVLLIRKESCDVSLQFLVKKNGVIGTSSARRKCQLKLFRSDLILNDIRGNVPTRIQKLRDGAFDGIMLAAAGVKRLQLDVSDLHLEVLNPKEFIPAPAQGVLGLQVRSEDKDLLRVLEEINHKEVQSCVQAERRVLNLFKGGCQLPLGAYCEQIGGIYHMWATMSEDWKEIPSRTYLTGDNPELLAQETVAKLSKKKDKKIYITRYIHGASVFRDVLEHNGFDLTAHSLIEFMALKFESVPACDWIFFSSKNAVKYFFDFAKDIPKEVKYGVVGIATEKSLNGYGHKASYVGHSNDTGFIAREFQSSISNQTVLFPGAKNGKRTIQKALSGTNKGIDLHTYLTRPVEEGIIPDADILIFTSPSNVDSYYTWSKVKAHQTVVAMGTTTANHLASKGVNAPIVPWSSSELALADMVLSL